MMIRRSLLVLTPVLAIAACVSPSAPPPAPPPPAPAPAPPPLAPTPVAANWEDRPVAPGIWGYRQDARGSIALFGAPGTDALLTVRCDTAAKRVFVSIPGTVAGRLTLRATSGAKFYPAVVVGGTPPHIAAEIAPNDPQLDAIAFSRGRFLVAFPGAADLVVPAWPDVARVVEDCRG